jgi:hypothetical protein
MVRTQRDGLALEDSDRLSQCGLDARDQLEGRFVGLIAPSALQRHLIL